MTTIESHGLQLSLEIAVLQTLCHYQYLSAALPTIMIPSNYTYQPVTHTTPFIAILRPPRRRLRDLIHQALTNDEKRFHEHIGTFATTREKKGYRLTALHHNYLPEIEMLANDLRQQSPGISIITDVLSNHNNGHHQFLRF